MQSPFCSIIVLNYNGEKFIPKTIASLVDLNYPKNRFEIIVVDNASQDKSLQIINDLVTSNKPNPTASVERGPVIRALSLQKNIGFAAGNNMGIRQATGEYVALLNNDCVVHPDWLKELVTCAQENEKIFAVNPKVYLGESNKIQNAGIRIFPNGYAQDIGAIPKNKKQDYEEDKGQYDTIREVDAACAVATLYRKSILDRIGLFDENFFMYYEDVEISERARSKGYKIVYTPKAIVHHQHAATSTEWSPFFIYHSERGRLMYMALHFPLTVFLKEFFVFKLKAKLRFLIRLITKPSTTAQNWQYIKVSWYMLIKLPYLFIRRISHPGFISRSTY